MHADPEGRRKPLSSRKIPGSTAGPKANRLRSTAGRSLIGAALGVSLLLGGAFLAVDQLHSTAADALNRPGESATDDQSRAQAVGAAKRIVDTAQLRATTAGYLLMSCRDQESPPYQGAVHLTFALPSEARTYLPTVWAALTSAGWIQGLPPGGHPFAKTFTKDAATAIIYRHDDDPNLGVLRVYGECSNRNDHRTDTTAWVDITDQVSLGH